VHAKVIYGIYIPNNVVEQVTKDSLAKELLQHPLLIHRDNRIDAVETPHVFRNKNVEFIIAVFFIGFVGVFRSWNSLYFRNLWRAFRNASLSKRQLREQLDQDSRAKILLNAFFCLSGAMYIYLVLNYFFQHDWPVNYSKTTVISGLFLCLLLVYSFRFLFLKITGWLFDIPEVMDSYSFQVFLINKILGILLIPFSIILAFGHGAWVQVSLLLSFVMIGFLFFFRYARSGAAFRYFLKLSRVRFFMYLCASEILPLAIFIKIISLWLYQ